jgi:8-oxo-dGTP pyrophosphatase MutT (NUDIX family)
MKRLLDGPGPFSRSSYDPGHFTASAFVLSPERDSLLLIFHAKLGLWLQPGGHVEPADVSVLDAARREVAEEVGLSELTAQPSPPALFDVDIHRIPARPKEPTHDHFDLRFLFVASTRAVRPNDEVKAAQWVPLENVENVTTDRSVTRAVEKLRAGSLISLE